MFTLMVSFDCGTHYEAFMKSEKIEELLERTEKKGGDRWEDITWKRWYIEEDGEWVNEIICPTHKIILGFLGKLNRKEENE